jgi:phosphoribosylformimino-5-aminoimidazole carboxamide ribotide isomerase
MFVLPVIDLQNGQVVRGIGGRRNEYRPIVSRLTKSVDPVEIARAFREHFGFNQLYLADLDAIGGADPAVGVYAAIRELGFALWVDAGIRKVPMAAPLAAAGVEHIVVGLETIRGPLQLQLLCREYGSGRIVFSLDLKEGEPFGKFTWKEEFAWGFAVQAIQLGVRQLIVLDLARVGSGTGVGTEELCGRLAAAYPDVTVIAGGGVRDITDIRRLQACGVRGVLVASALHDGRLSPHELKLPFSDLQSP